MEMTTTVYAMRDGAVLSITDKPDHTRVYRSGGRGRKKRVKYILTAASIRRGWRTAKVIK